MILISVYQNVLDINFIKDLRQLNDETLSMKTPATINFTDRLWSQILHLTLQHRSISRVDSHNSLRFSELRFLLRISVRAQSPLKQRIVHFSRDSCF